MTGEDYISFETAKLLKEKGFNKDTYTMSMYDENGEAKDVLLLKVGEEPVLRPTIQMAMKWLREKHNLFVFPFPQMNTNKFWVEIYQLSNNQEWENLYCESIDLQDYSLYKEATEAGIKYCLENLI